MTHTPTPWSVNAKMETWIMAGHLHVATIPRAGDGDWSPANAAFIVRAVNSHDALVEALDRAATHLDVAASAFDASGENWWARRARVNAEDARAALALAKGEAEE